MTSLLAAIVRIFTEGLTPEERRKFARVIWDIILAANLFWTWGLLGFVNGGGIVTANEVNSRIRTALEPILEELRKITYALERSESNQRRLLEEAMILKLRDLQKQCLASTPDSALRNRLVRDIISAQYEYRQLTGEFYPLPTQCD